jgi:general stress protein 26
MPARDPVTELHPQFSSPDAQPTQWARARGVLQEAQIYWLTTVRPDGRPHVTPLLCVWLDDAVYFCTGDHERKAKNLAHNAHCIITTGCNVLEGVDVVVEGEAVQVTDTPTLERLAEAYVAKYDWHYTVRDGAFHHAPGPAAVYAIAPKIAFGFSKGAVSGQTRFRF